VTGWRDRPLADLLDEYDLTGVPERPFPTDGWSGATFTTVDRSDGRRYVLKRASPAYDWIVRATRDEVIREAWLAGTGMRDEPWLGPSVGPISVPFLGAAIDADGAAVILMPDLAEALGAWHPVAGGRLLAVGAMDLLLDRVAALHALPWSEVLNARAARDGHAPPPWCPLPERLTLLTPRSAAGYAAEGNPVGERFLEGWAGFERHAPAAARDLVGRLADDPGPLIRALSRLPGIGLHGDIKLANVARHGDGAVTFIDWQMTLRAPVAVELGWCIVTNSAELPLPPDQILARYRASLDRVGGHWRFGEQRFDADAVLGDWALQVDLSMIIGLTLRGWRKGLDTVADGMLASGVTAADDLAWWCARAVEAAERRL
jgi:hypothetical protein